MRTPTRVTAERIAVPGGEAPPVVERSGARRSPTPAGGEFAAGAVRPVLDGPLRRARGEHGPAADVTRERYHEFRYRQDIDGSECVPVLLTALGRITGTDTGSDDGDYARDDRHGADHAVVADRRPAPARIAGAVGRASRPWPRARFATRCPTTPGWCWPPSSARCCHRGRDAAGIAGRGRGVSGHRAQPDPGRHAGAVRGGRRIDGARCRLDDDGHRQTHRTRPRA